MKQFLDLLPVALFVTTFFVLTDKDIFVSTAVLMAAVLAQVICTYLFFKKIDKQTQIVFWVVMIFGGATLLFRNETFIQWKPTVINWFFGIALMVSHMLGKNLLEQMLGSQMKLPQRAWRNLVYGWSAGFFLAGALNLIVAYYFSLEIWVTYKLIGGFGLTLCYIVLTVVYLMQGGYVKEESLIEESREAENPSRSESTQADS